MQKALATTRGASSQYRHSPLAGIKKPVLLHRPKGVGKVELSGCYQHLPRRASRLKAPGPAAARARKPPATERFFMNISICICSAGW